MTPHISGSSLSAQARYAAGTREILEDWLAGKPIRSEYLIVEGGKFRRYRGQVLPTVSPPNHRRGTAIRPLRRVQLNSAARNIGANCRTRLEVSNARR
jgi:hypothetical protein